MRVAIAKEALTEKYNSSQAFCVSEIFPCSYEMKTIDETMSIIHMKNNHRKINTLEVIEILKAASSKYLFNDVIAGQNALMYKLLPSPVI